MKPQCWFWFVHAKGGSQDVGLAVAAFTERSARRQARKQLGPAFEIGPISAVGYAHAWPIDVGWRAHGKTP